jgi:hypothetical protein
MVEEDILYIEALCNQHAAEPDSFSLEEVVKQIKSLKAGKAADSDGISAEHIKYGGIELAKILQQLYNKILQVATYPTLFKLGLITPIHKKAGKPQDDPDMYRKITVNSILGKVFEKLYLTRVKPKIRKEQSPLQFGFTEELSPTIAAVLMSEAIIESDEKKSPLYISFMDTKKAFDVVWHPSLLRRLFLLGVEGKIWLIMKQMYQDMTAKVKWQGHLSETLQIAQGLQQGGIGSADCYKVYENPLPLLLERTNTGHHIGAIYLGIILVADDKALRSDTPEGLQVSLNTATNHANKERYENGLAKSQVMV